MARPAKVGLSYFPMDVDISDNDKIAMIEALHGAEGFRFIVKILCKIYDNSYFCEWDKRSQILYANRVNVNINTINAITNTAIEEGLFNREMYEKYEILTSKNIQEQYIDSTSRRKEITFLEKYLLLEDIMLTEKTPRALINVVNDDNKIVNVYINPKNVDISTQSKSKSKRKDIKDLPEKPKKEKPDEKEQLKKMLTRYREGFAAVTKQYWEVIKETRTTKKVAKSVILRNMAVWEKYEPTVVEYALKKHMQDHKGMKEEYTVGIMRNTTAEEAAARMDQIGKPKRQAKGVDIEALKAGLNFDEETTNV